ncbi:hypothetical protein EDD85DRAFT_431167 [Armillaria nabsnona]|nr:hypothetical protein EDD85DRAFT_431167 [Armillaria nabsnona]
MFVVLVPVCRCFMGPSSAADAALFLEMVCCNVALPRCLFPRPQVLLLLLPHSFLDGGVLQMACLTQCLRFVGSVP